MTTLAVLLLLLQTLLMEKRRTCPRNLITYAVTRIHVRQLLSSASRQVTLPRLGACFDTFSVTVWAPVRWWL